ncbi:MAG: RluA family pseudouridine synthase [bacterium]|nr:RluA family pseudouridine synthase [bacterium]
MTPAGARRVAFTVRAVEEGLRLDQVLALRVPGLSRRQARVLLDLGGVFVDGRRVRIAGRGVRAGQAIVAHVGGALARATKDVGRAARARDEAALPPVPVVHQDMDVIVVDKPPGILSAPTPESDRTNLVSLLSRRTQPPEPVFLVHRIDRPTSGLLVFARSALANRALGEAFRTHDVEREYVAVVCGAVPDALATIDAPLGGRRAVTHLAVAGRLGTVATVLRCRLETGRTHQIRLHCRGAGHPVLGDADVAVAGGPEPPRLALHAAVLGFRHPRSGEPLRFTSPLPADLAGWLEALRTRVAAGA